MTFRTLTAATMAAVLAIAVVAQEHHDGAGHAATSELPTEPGQGAFAAIAEIVARLNAEAKTDWANVKINGLRQHLIDMDNVTLRSVIEDRPSPGGVVFTVTSTNPAVAASIRRMVLVHAATMDGSAELRMTAGPRPDGADLTVTGEEARIRALGFIGVMTLGMHHQAHHWAIATGSGPHD